MDVHDDAYPGTGNNCRIWVPSEAKRQEYLNIFSNPANVQDNGAPGHATVADVSPSNTVYGYRTSPLPPRYTIALNAMNYDGETPIYPFVGQMVPGTNVKYVTPAILSVWLVDLKDVNGDGTLDTIPALTTIDFRKFMSINWPRDRYMSAITGMPTETISGYQSVANKTVSGVILLNGDYGIWPSQTLTISPGTILLMNDNDNIFNIDIATPITTGRVELVIANQGTLVINGTPQSPIILTSRKTSAMPADWACVTYALGAQTQTMNYTVTEYAYVNTIINTNLEFDHNISRYSELPTAPPVAEGIFVANGAPTISNSEFHNNSISIHLLGEGGSSINGTRIYNNEMPYMASGHYDVTKGIFTGGKPGLETISNNILMKCIVGLSPEDGSTSRNHIYQNISTLNNIGVGMYYESTSPVPQPRLENNDVWWNWSTDTIPPDLQANFVRATAATGAINVNKEYTNNLSQDPRFRNVEIFDLVHDVDNDALFSDTEEKIETDPWFEDTDGDGLSDGVETNTRIYKGPNDTGSDPLNPDTNGNGINDGLEVQFGHDPSLIGDGFRIPGVGNSGLATLVITICLLGMYMSKKSSRMSRLSRTDL